MLVEHNTLARANIFQLCWQFLGKIVAVIPEGLAPLVRLRNFNLISGIAFLLLAVVCIRKGYGMLITHATNLEGGDLNLLDWETQEPLLYLAGGIVLIAHGTTAVICAIHLSKLRALNFLLGAHYYQLAFVPLGTLLGWVGLRTLQEPAARRQFR